MSADELRKAADTLREMSEAVDARESWSFSPGHDGMVGDPASEALLAFIGTMSPGVGLALAAWLDDIAAGWMWDGEEPGVVDWEGDRLTLEDSMDSHALRLARLINGGAA